MLGGRLQSYVTHLELKLYHSRLFFIGGIITNESLNNLPSLLYQNAQERTINPARISLLPPALAFQVKTVVFSVPSHHIPHPRLIRATPTQFVNSHNEFYRLCYALRHRLQTGAKYGTISELAWMKVTELKHSVSRRLTQPPVRLCVSPVWRSPASFSEHHFVEPVQGILLYKHRSWTS